MNFVSMISKTSIDHGLDFAPNNFQRYFDDLSGKSGKQFVELFFDLLYRLQADNLGENVVGYALKRFAKVLATNSEKQLVREYLQRLIYAAPHNARWVFPLLLGIYRELGANEEIRRIVKWGIEVSARRNDSGSLIWFLYAALFLDIRLSSAQCEQCIGVSSTLIDVMLFHGRNKGIFTFNVVRLTERYQLSPFNSDAWLVLYEVERRGWDQSSAFQKIATAADAGGLYERLRNSNVDFYLTDPDIFDVAAFPGWNLKQRDFGEPRPVRLAFDDWDFEDRDENYE